MSDPIIGTIVPEHFLPSLGYLSIRQTQMDQAVDRTISRLTGFEPNRLNALISTVMNLSTRLEMLKNAIILSVFTTEEKCKLEVIRREIRDLNGKRNRIYHDLPYSYSPSKDSLSYVRKEILTFPQVTVKPPLHFTPGDIVKIGDEMLVAETWLGLPFSNYRDGVYEPHPNWNDDGKFPWPDRYALLLQNADQAQA